MEPRFFKRGNPPKTSSSSSARCAASMEPRFFKRGNSRTAVPHNGRQAASMEPRFFKRGNVSEWPTMYFLPSLQWNHVFSNVEIIPPALFSFRNLVRFNGTTFFQTWKYGMCCKTSDERACFNGTTFFQTWKFVDKAPSCGRLRASMEPRFFKRGNPSRKTKR